MTSEIVSVHCGGKGLVLPGPPGDSMLRWFSNTDNALSPAQCYQLLLDGCESDVIIYIHDDVTIHDADWLTRVMACFETRPNCVAVGLGGATALGSRDLYRKPFNIWAMARRGYASNQTDAEVHGGRFGGTRRVAVLDAFFLAVRTDWLRSRVTREYLEGHAGELGAYRVKTGWPIAHLTHHCLDLWLACEAARAGREIWMVGVSCTHHGGGSSTTAGYASASWLQGGTMEQDHQIPHKWLWEEYRDVLPVEVEGGGNG